MKQLLLCCLILFTLSACKKVDVPDGTPSCIKQMIRKMEREGSHKKGTVEKLMVNGVVYYVFPAPSQSRDAFDEMYNEYCEYVCAPSGGITGKGSSDCPDLQGAIITSIYKFSE